MCQRNNHWWHSFHVLGDDGRQLWSWIYIELNFFGESISERSSFSLISEAISFLFSTFFDVYFISFRNESFLYFVFIFKCVRLEKPSYLFSNIACLSFVIMYYIRLFLIKYTYVHTAKHFVLLCPKQTHTQSHAMGD